MAAFSVLGTTSAQLGMLGAYVSIIAGLFVSYMQQEEHRECRRRELLQLLGVPIHLARDAEFLRRYELLSRAIEKMSESTDPILREFALLKLVALGEQCQTLADGTVVFSGTEAWRNVYEQLLKSPDVRRYLSVAWVRSKEYWQDQPGRQSLELNYNAVDRGVRVHRIVILRDELWPKRGELPVEPVCSWIEEQHAHGLWVGLVRESEISHEADLLADIGIYGDRAVGTQELDEASRTTRFVLSFAPQAIELAKDRWQRLKLYSISYRKLLDQLPPDD